MNPRRMKLHGEWKLDLDKFPQGVRQCIAPQVAAKNTLECSRPMLSLGERIAGTRFGRVRQPNKEDQARRAVLKLQIDNTSQEYYLKYQRMRFQKDAANKVADLLTSLHQKYPLEWAYCGWKNVAIAELMLGRFSTFAGTPKSRQAVAGRWLKEYWKREEEIARETDTYLSPKRMAARAAAFELEMLQLANDPEPWIRPGLGDYAAFVRWLNKNWGKFAAKKKGAALLKALAGKFHRERPRTPLGDGDLVEVLHVYGRIASSYSEDAVPPSAVVLTMLARRHNVSPRLVTKVRAEASRHLLSQSAPPKAR